MSALAVGTRFELIDDAGWSAPCPVCGRVKATTFVKAENGRRRREVCREHALLLGTEKTEILGVITEAFTQDGRDWVRWRALEEKTTGAPPWNPGGRKLRAGLAEVALFLENLGSRKVRVLL